MFPVSAKVGSLALLWAVIVGVPLGCLAAFKSGNLGGQLPACAVYHRYLHAGIRSGNPAVTYPLRRYRRSKSISGTVLTEHRQVMYCRVRHLDSIRCVICPDRPERAMLDAINQEYIKTARAKGLKNSKIIFKHALRNALIPRLSLTWGPQIAFTLCGGLVVETVFSIPDWDVTLYRRFRTVIIR